MLKNLRTKAGEIYTVDKGALPEMAQAAVSKMVELHFKRLNLATAFRLGIVFTDEKGNRDWFGFLAAMRELE